jgi:hypothetical protein
VTLTLGCPAGGHGPITLVDDGGCVAQCGKCAPQAVCIATPYLPACLPGCTATSDCLPGSRCAVLSLDPDAPSVCVNADALVWCHLQTCDIHPQCRDSQTLLRPLPFGTKICGYELVRCDSSCDTTTAQCK